MDNKNNKIARFGSILYAPELPALYNQGLTDYEILVRLASVINNNAEIMNSWQKTAEELEKILSDTDEIIKQKVIEVIQNMYENGELAEIIENIIREQLTNIEAPKEFLIDTRREFRIALWSMPYNATDFNNLNYSYNQGGRYFIKDGTPYYVGCYRISNSRNLYYKNDNADVRLYAYIDGKWQFVRNQIYSLGHANDIKYIAHLNKFFVVKAAEFNGGDTETGSLDICVIDWTLPAQLEATFSIPSGLIFPRRDRISAIDYFDDKFYFLIGSGGQNPIQIYTCDISSDNYAITNFEEYAVFYISKNAGTNYVMQGAGFCQNDDYIFIGNTAPAGIYRFNKHNKKIDCFYNIGPYTNNHMFPTGEVENLSIVNDELFIGTSIHGSQRLSYFDYNQIFSFNYITGSCANKVVTSYGGYNRNIYIGSETESLNVDYYDREICNPNGLRGDSGKPFPTWEETALFINAQNLWTTIRIIPLTRNVAGYLALDLSKCNVLIDGSEFYNSMTDEEVESDKYSRIAGLYVEGGNLTISQMLIINRAPEASGAAYANYQIYARFTVLNLHNCYLIPYLRPEGSKLLYINRSFANLGTVYDVNNSAISWKKNNMDFYFSSINTHNHWTDDANVNIIG